jgi:myosin heavy subunit
LEASARETDLLRERYGQVEDEARTHIARAESNKEEHLQNMVELKERLSKATTLPPSAINQWQTLNEVEQEIKSRDQRIVDFTQSLSASQAHVALLEDMLRKCGVQPPSPPPSLASSSSSSSSSSSPSNEVASTTPLTPSTIGSQLADYARQHHDDIDRIQKGGEETKQKLSTMETNFKNAKHEYNDMLKEMERLRRQIEESTARQAKFEAELTQEKLRAGLLEEDVKKANMRVNEANAEVRRSVDKEYHFDSVIAAADLRANEAEAALREMVLELQTLRGLRLAYNTVMKEHESLRRRLSIGGAATEDGINTHLSNSFDDGAILPSDLSSSAAPSSSTRYVSSSSPQPPSLSSNPSPSPSPPLVASRVSPSTTNTSSSTTATTNSSNNNGSTRRAVPTPSLGLPVVMAMLDQPTAMDQHEDMTTTTPATTTTTTSSSAAARDNAPPSSRTRSRSRSPSPSTRKDTTPPATSSKKGAGRAKASRRATNDTTSSTTTSTTKRRAGRARAAE